LAVVALALQRLVLLVLMALTLFLAQSPPQAAVVVDQVMQLVQHKQVVLVAVVVDLLPTAALQEQPTKVAQAVMEPIQLIVTQQAVVEVQILLVQMELQAMVAVLETVVLVLQLLLLAHL
jgi:hypothetical protein